MKRARLVVFWLCLWSVAGMTLAAQQMSEKKDLSIFKLNYYGAPAYEPSTVTVSATIGESSVSVSVTGSGNADVDAVFQQTIGQVDQTIQQVFFELGRFNIISMPQRLSTDDVAAFIDAIKAYKEQSLVIPDAVALGRQVFTEADFNKLVGSFVIVVPTVTFYDLVADDGFEASITTNFSIIDVADNKLIGQFKIDTTGYDSDSGTKAMKQAVDSIPLNLTYEVRKVPAFQINTGITEIVGVDIILEFGSNMGLQPGDEYNIFRSEQIGSYLSEKATGLLIIKEVREQFSIAQVIYADPAPVIGDQLREAPRLGVDLTPYVNAMVGLNSGESIGLLVGVRTAISRGFFGFRPTAGLELAFGDSFPTYLGWFGLFIPASLYVGGEYNIYLGRLKFVPEAAVGVTGYIRADFDGVDSDFFALTHLRLQAKATLSFLITDTIEVFAQGGFLFGLPVTSSVASYVGPVAGAGVTFK